jgi:hypothetical protein
MYLQTQLHYSNRCTIVSSVERLFAKSINYGVLERTVSTCNTRSCSAFTIRYVLSGGNNESNSNHRYRKLPITIPRLVLPSIHRRAFVCGTQWPLSVLTLITERMKASRRMILMHCLRRKWNDWTLLISSRAFYKVCYFTKLSVAI